MRFPRALSLLLALLLTACPGSSPVNPPDGGSSAPDAGGAPLTFDTDELPDATVSQPYRVTLAASGGSPAYSWHLVQGSLPAGLTLSSAGELSGTPSTPGLVTFTLEVRDSAGQAALRLLGVDVRASGFTLATSALPDAYLGGEYAAPLAASGGTAPYTWVLASGALPSGVRLGAEGRLSGTPVAPGTFTVTLSVHDASGLSARRDLTLSVLAPPSLSSTPLALGVVDVPYSASLRASGGRGPLTFRVSSGSLPAGLRLEGGAVLGTPSAPDTASFTVEVQDRNDRSASAPFQLTVRGGLTITSTVPPDAYMDATYGHGLSASGGQPPYTWAFAGGSLPTGLELSPNGMLSGRPWSTGTFSFTARVTDSGGHTATRTLSLTAYWPPSLSGPALQLEGHVGEPFSAAYSVTLGKPPYSFFTSGTLPSWLTLSGSGQLSGTPPSTDPVSGRVIVSDANGRTHSRDFALTVFAPVHITSTSLPEARSGEPYSASLGSSGGKAPMSWSILSGALPSGLTLSASGAITGTPTAAGTANLTVLVQDARGREDSRALSLTVRGAGTPFTVGHWNIEWFGSAANGPPNSSSDGGTSDDLQIAHARDILGDAGVNVWGLVEMVDRDDFATLKAQLPGYSGFLANDVSFVPGGSFYYGPGEQKPGILYDSSLTFRGAQLILTSNAADFGGRPPLRVDFTVRIRDADVPLIVIVLHMKAFDDEVSYAQRRQAGLALKNHLDALPSERVFVIGDWNDDVDQSITRGDGGTYLTSPFEPFVLDTSRYTFVTRPLSLGRERTTTHYPETIDHTLATNELAVDYRPGSVRVLRPDGWIPGYAQTVSDHYPVISRYDLGSGGNLGPAPAPDLFINEVLANEPAPDGGVGDPHYEFIEVINAGDASADLSGWSLWDSVAVKHVFPSGTALAPGRAIVVYGGVRGFPPGTAGMMAASTGQLGLNNDGDIPSLRAPDGGTVDLVSYGTTTDNVSINRRPDAVPDAGFVPHTTLNPGLGSSAGRRADGGTF